jgi:hypothetical protein
VSNTGPRYNEGKEFSYEPLKGVAAVRIDLPSEPRARWHIDERLRRASMSRHSLSDAVNRMPASLILVLPRPHLPNEAVRHPGALIPYLGSETFGVKLDQSSQRDEVPIRRSRCPWSRITNRDSPWYGPRWCRDRCPGRVTEVEMVTEPASNYTLRLPESEAN